jgi:quercetin dioxygenase-like cupin family protein
MSDGVGGDPPPNIRKIALSDFPREPLTPDHFTGGGLLRHIADPEAGLRVLHVHFEAGVQTRPHFHTGSQILWFLEGAGEVASPREVIPCQPGDVVRIDRYAEHRHGAAGNGTSTTSHLAITAGDTVWQGDAGWDQRR